MRDARVAELRGEIDRVNASLRGAHETIKDLRVAKAGVERRLVDEQATNRRVMAVLAYLEASGPSRSDLPR